MEILEETEKKDIYFLKVSGVTSIKINIDAIVLPIDIKSHDSDIAQFINVAVLSLFDSPTLIDKFNADLCSNASVSYELHSYENGYICNLNFNYNYKKMQQYNKQKSRKKHLLLLAQTKFIAYNVYEDDEDTFFIDYINRELKIPCDVKTLHENKEFFKKINFLGHNEELKKMLGDVYFIRYTSFLEKAIKSKKELLPEIKTIEDFIFKCPSQIASIINKTVTPLYNGNKKYYFENFKITPKEGQESMWGAGIEVLKKDKFVYLSAEMGSGKN